MPALIGEKEVTCPNCQTSVVLEQYDGDSRTTVLRMEQCTQCSCYSIQKTHQCPNCSQQFRRNDVKYCSGNCKIQTTNSCCQHCVHTENCSRCSRGEKRTTRGAMKHTHKTQRSKQLNKNIQNFNEQRITYPNCSFMNSYKLQYPLASAYADALSIPIWSSPPYVSLSSP